MIESLLAPFRRRKDRKLYFALAVADRPTDGFKFTADKDCTVFIVTGSVMPTDVIPRSTLKAVVDKFEKVGELQGKVVVSDKS